MYLTIRNVLSVQGAAQTSCFTGNPINDCWWCDPNRAAKHNLADCGIGAREKGDAPTSCFTGNPINDCWFCDPNWPANQKLADYGMRTREKGDQIYIVIDFLDSDPANPIPGTLRRAMIGDKTV